MITNILALITKMSILSYWKMRGYLYIPLLFKKNVFRSVLCQL